MKNTSRLAPRAVRAFMTTTGPRPAADPIEAIETETAHRLTAALLRARRERQPPSPHDSPVSSSTTLGQTPVEESRRRALRAGAASLGRSAYLVHSAHQAAHQATPTAKLLQHVQDTWAGWSAKERAKWVGATPQGRRVLRALSLDGATNKHRAPTASPDSRSDTMCLRPRLDRAVSSFSALPATRRVPAAAASTAGPIHYTPRPPTPIAASAPHHQEVVIEAAYSPNTHTVAGEVRAARMRQQRAQWQAQMQEILGADGAFVYANDVKKLQVAPAEDDAEEALVDDSAPAEAKSTPESSLREQCARHHIGSPRKVFVMQKLLPLLESTDDEAKLGSMIPLGEVQSKAQAFSDEYDRICAQVQRTWGAAGLQAYQQELLLEEVSRVDERQTAFQTNLPLTKKLVDSRSATRWPTR